MNEPTNYLKQPEGWRAGIYHLESYEQYASIKALRSSELKKLRKSPAHYKASFSRPKSISAQLEKTFAKGKAFDVLTLHGHHDFEHLITIEPDLNRNTKAYKQWKEKNAGATCILTQEEKKDILDMHTAALKKCRFTEIFEGDGTAHRVIIWQDSATGIWCKAEIDWICSDGTVVDLKSTSDAGFFFFSRNAYRLGYFNQGAHYLNGLTHLTGIKHEKFLLAAVEVEPPFESHVFKVSYEQISRAAQQNEYSMAILKQCFETGNWPGYPDVLLDLDTGHYIFEDLEEEEGEAIRYGF